MLDAPAPLSQTDSLDNRPKSLLTLYEIPAASMTHVDEDDNFIHVDPIEPISKSTLPRFR